MTTRQVRQNSEISKFGQVSPPELRVGINNVIRKRECSWCDKPNFKFRDTLSRNEYGISAMCQTCQDEVFGKEAE